MYAERQLIKEANFALYAGYYALLCWFFFPLLSSTGVAFGDWNSSFSFTQSLNQSRPTTI